MRGLASVTSLDAVAHPFEKFVSRRGGQRPAAVALVALVHLIAVWAIFANIRPSHILAPVAEFQLTVLKPAVTPTSLPPPPREWRLQQPKDALVSEPDIQIAPDAESPPVTTSMMSQILPPRPDPYYINKAPNVPDTLKAIAMKAAVTVRILVLPDGSVDRALLVKGSSNATLDRLALAFVEANWRFQPAMTGGKPIEDWMTVLVRFGS